MYFVHPQLKSLKPLFKKTSDAGLKQKLAKFFPNRYILFTDSGRSAFRVAVKELGLENSEMLVPAYLCDIFLPIFQRYGIKPIFLDIDLKTFNINISEIEEKITPQTKSILASHTYGTPNEMDKILEIAKKHNLKIIEDCAHAFGIKYQDKFLGNFGDCAIFSLPKFLPVVCGGMLILKNPMEAKLKKPKFKFFNLIRFLRLFPFLATFSENFRSSYDDRKDNLDIARQAPKTSLKIFDWYLENFEEQISKRKELADYFHKKLKEIGFQSSGISYISALTPKSIDRDKLFYNLRKKNIFCSRIWHKPIYPDLPNAREAAERTINLPLQNWYTEKDIDYLVRKVQSSISED